MNKFLELLKQPSTWKGVTALLVLVGVNLEPEAITTFINAGLIIYGALAVLWDKN